MTDTYDEGSESHDHVGDESLMHSEAPQEPSEYEFNDDPSGAAAMEHTEDHGAVDAKPARRSPLVPIAAAAGGVLLLGAVAWWQLSGPSSSDVVLAAPPAITAIPAAPPPLAVAETPALPVAPKSAATPTVVDASVAATEASAMPAPAVAQVPVAVIPAAPVPSVPVAVVPAPAPVVASVVENVVPAAAPVALVPVVGGGAQDQRIADLSMRLDALQKALDQANASLGQVTTELAAPGSPGNKDMQDRINKLEQEMTDLRHGTLSAVTSPADVVVADNHPLPKPVVSHRAASVHKVVVAHKTKKKAVVEAAAKQAASVHWVLRSASPGQAWVSSGAASTDLKQVQVGDTLPGIGRVTAIQNQGDNWVVQGTQGKIQ